MILSLLFPVPLEAETRSHVALGYDSFIDRFTILEADTFESVQDLYIGLGNSLYYRSGASKAGFSNLLKIGNQTIDEHLDAEGSLAAAGSVVMDLKGALHWKHFNEGSDYAFGNDYYQTNALLRLRANTGDNARLSLRSRFELVDYEDKTDFDYDYRYADGGVEWETGDYLDGMLHLGLVAGRRSVPDTTALSYDRFAADFETRFSPFSSFTVQLASAADRKRYLEAARSSYWSVLSQVDLTRSFAGRAALSLRAESELLRFDRPDPTYFDTHFLRAGVRARFPVRDLSAVSVEPRFAMMLCAGFPEERYEEISCILAAEIMTANGLWLSLAYEPGRREYELEENDLYSNFTIHRLSAMGSVPMPAGATLNVLVTHEPERHSRREDDFAVTLVSVDLIRRF